MMLTEMLPETADADELFDVFSRWVTHQGLTLYPAQEEALIEIVSGAGHDAAYVARVAPAAMIFVPCRDGISHNEAEFSSKEQCAAGAQVLPYFKGTRGHSDLVTRRLVSANIDGQSYDLHLDLGDVPSQLRHEHWAGAKLPKKGKVDPDESVGVGVGFAMPATVAVASAASRAQCTCPPAAITFRSSRSS